MKNKLSLFLVLIFGISVIFVVGLRSFGPTASPNLPGGETNLSYQLQKDERGSVVVEATPLSLKPGNNASFTLTFTTHSGDLSYDIAAIAKLTDNKGNTYNPISWSGGKGGHHIEGTLTFPKISAEADSVTLKIPGIDNTDRVFSWDLK